jgi:NAD+ synthase
MMKRFSDGLNVDPAAACQQIESLLREKLRQMGRDGILIGLSGGLDSAIAAYLSVRSVGSEKVALLYMPDRDSKDIHREHAHLIADELGVELQVRDLTPVLETIGSYDLLPIKFIPGQGLRELAVRLGKSFQGGDYLAERMRAGADTLVARGNAYAGIKHRMRMVLLYHQAEISNLMIVGAANKTEFLTGTFSKWGCDQCADVMPIVHLYRSHLPPIAAFLGIPEAVRTKPADPDVVPGVNDKGQLLGSFLLADRILWGVENGIEVAELEQLFGRREVERIVTLHELSGHMRESPYGVV